MKSHDGSQLSLRIIIIQSLNSVIIVFITFIGIWNLLFFFIILLNLLVFIYSNYY